MNSDETMVPQTEEPATLVETVEEKLPEEEATAT